VSHAAADVWAALTDDDLIGWAGEKTFSRGRSYQRNGHVSRLARTASGDPLAWVQGTERYATRVTLTAGRRGRADLESECTCPVGVSCKHAVAVALAYRAARADGTPVPEASEHDPRLVRLEEGEDGWSDEFDDEEDEQGRPVAPPRGEAAGHVRAWLEGLPAADLVALVMELAGRDRATSRELETRATLARSEAGELVRQARREIARRTAEEAWRNGWSGEGSTPDYGPLRRLLKRLLELGRADELLELGEELFEAGSEQVGRSDDEGETTSAIAGCLDLVFQAVPASSRSDGDKLLYALNMVLNDEYSLVDGAARHVLDREWPAAAWSAAADGLIRRLNDWPSGRGQDDFTDKYRRDRLSRWLIRCLERAGRGGEVRAVAEAEARHTGNYVRLIDQLTAAGELDDARRWALEGLERTDPKLVGITHQLRERLRDLATRRKDWAEAAGWVAEEFFARPGVETLTALERAAHKAGCREAVRAAALKFLETGVRPAPAATSAARARTRKPPDAGWPLPKVPASERTDARPRFDVLLDLAIHEKRPDDVLHWYDRLTASRPAGGWHGGGSDIRVADAVAGSHPERAAAIYQRAIEALVAQTSPSSYEQAAPHLKKLRALWRKAGRVAEWTAYVAKLREEHRRKRRWLEVLDRVERGRT
jgi:uncharacterized Zn finger protein